MPLRVEAMSCHQPRSRALLKTRLNGKPLAHLTGRWTFTSTEMDDRAPEEPRIAELSLTSMYVAVPPVVVSEAREHRQP